MDGDFEFEKGKVIDRIWQIQKTYDSFKLCKSGMGSMNKELEKISVHVTAPCINRAEEYFSKL